MKTIEYKFDLYDKVDTPLLTKGSIVTMLGYQDGIVKYYIENATQGVGNKWWPESQLTKV